MDVNQHAEQSLDMLNQAALLAEAPVPKGKKGLNIGMDVDRVKDTLVNFIVPLVCFGLAGVLFLFVLYPSHKDMPKYKSDLKAAIDKKDSLTTKLENLKKLVVFKAAVDENSDLVTRILANEPAEPKLLDQVNQMAVNSGFKVTRLSYSGSGSGSKKDASRVDIALGADGNLDQLILFVEKAESAARLILIDSLRYSREVTKTGDEVLAVNLSLNSPYLFVKSDAITDDPVNVDLSSETFIKFMNKIKDFQVYTFSNLPLPPSEEPKDATEVVSDPNTQ